MKKKKIHINNKKRSKNTTEIIRQRVMARLSNELEKKGGFGPRESHFNSGIEGGSDAIGAIISNLTNTIINGGAAIVDGIGATISIAKLPFDLRSIATRPNEPLPSNTRLAKAINYI